MIIKIDRYDSKLPELMKKYTVKNKNIEREEKRAGRSLPRKRFIKLYTEI
jgi:hypothetical protein